MANFVTLTKNAQFVRNLDAFTKASVGVREKPLGSNDGPEVRVYQHSVNEWKPGAWCAGYIRHQMVNSAGHCTPVLYSKWPAYSNCNDIYAWAKRNNLILDYPTDWCVFLLRHATDVHRYIHTGFVKQVLSNGKLLTREGNTNDNGSANGDGVYEKNDRVAKSSRMVYIPIV